MADIDARSLATDAAQRGARTYTLTSASPTAGWWTALHPLDAPPAPDCAAAEPCGCTARARAPPRSLGPVPRWIAAVTRRRRRCHPRQCARNAALSGLALIPSGCDAPLLSHLSATIAQQEPLLWRIASLCAPGALRWGAAVGALLRGGTGWARAYGSV